MKPKISVLVSARKDSKYLAKFLFGYFLNTFDTTNTELLIITNVHDTWNKELIDYFNDTEDITFKQENYELGRAGLHVYFNDLLQDADGDWVIYFCEDHFITMPKWDEYIRQVINGGSRGIKGEPTKQKLDPKLPYCIVPKFDNVGAMNQILSRGYIKAIGDMGKHGWIDSYINDVNHAAFGVNVNDDKTLLNKHVILMDDPIAHDFTHDIPNPMEPVPVYAPKAHNMPKYEETIVKQLIEQDAERLRRAIQE